MLHSILKRVVLPVGIATLLFAGVLKAPVENVIAYQGRAIGSDGNNFDGMGDFRFALVDDTGTIRWSNSTLDGSFVPMNAVTIQVTKGLFSILLGDTGQDPIPDSVFTNFPILFLRIWFNDNLGGEIEQLAPDQRVALLGRAFFAKVAGDAATLEGSASSDFLDKATYDTDGDGTVGDADELGGLDSSEFGILDEDNIWTGNSNTFDNNVIVSTALTTPSVQSDNGSLALMAGDGEAGDLTIDADGSVIVTASSDVDINSSFSDVNINALNGDINLNASVTTINLNADTSVMGELDMNGNDITNVGSNITGSVGSDLTISHPSANSDVYLESNRNLFITSADNQLDLTSGGSIRLSATTGSIELKSFGGGAGTTLLSITDVTNNDTVVNVADFSHEVSGGNGDDGIGSAIQFKVADDVGDLQTIGRIEAVATDASTASVDSELRFHAQDDGVINEVMILNGNGDLSLTGALKADSFTAGDSSTVYSDQVISQGTAGGNFTVDVAGGDAAGEDFIVLADNFSVDAGGNVITGGTFSAGGTSFNGDVDLGANSILDVGTVDFGAGGDDDLVANDVTTLTGNSDASALHHHDGRYYSQTELGSTVGTTGAGLIGVKDVFDNSANTDVQNVLADFDGAITGAAAQQNLFETINVPSGTDPVADGANDILTFLEGSGISISGNAGTDSVTVSSTSTLQNAYDNGGSIAVSTDAVQINDDTGATGFPNLQVTSSTVLTGSNARSIVRIQEDEDHDTSDSLTAIVVDLDGNYMTGNNDTTAVGIRVDLTGVSASATDTLIGVDVLMPNSTDVGFSTDGSLIVGGDTQLGTTANDSIVLQGTVENSGSPIEFSDDLALEGNVTIENTFTAYHLSFVGNSAPPGKDLTVNVTGNNPVLSSFSGTVITVDEDLDVSGDTSTTNVFLGDGNANTEGYVAVTLTSAESIAVGAVVAIKNSGKAFNTDPDPGAEAIGVAVEAVGSANMPIRVAIAGIVNTKMDGGIGAGKEVGGCGTFGNADSGCSPGEILGWTIEAESGGFAKVLIRRR